MDDLQIFIVFHKTLFDDCYKNIPHDVLQKYFTFYAVNEKIEKSYTRDKYKIINEWDLPIYDKTFQERGYNENSAIYHIYANNLHSSYKYIGFFQYDMIFNENIIETFQTIGNSTTLGFSFHDYNFCTWNEPQTLNYIINDYETYFNKSFSYNGQYPLYNSFIIPTETYERIMKCVLRLYDKLFPWCTEAPNKQHVGHIGGIYERIMAFAIGEEHLRSLTINVSHNHELKYVCY